MKEGEVRTAAIAVDTDTTDVQTLRAERDAAVAALRRRDQAKARRHLTRRVLTAVFVVLFAVLVPVTITATWAHRTVLNTSAYVDTVAPIAADPAVTAAVSRELTDQLYTALDPQQVIAGALPPRAAFLAGPIANGAKDNVRQAVNQVLNSKQFQQLWVGANRFAHARLVAVLRGDPKVLQTTGGMVVLNLVPLLNEALQRANTFVSGVVGRPVTLPTVTSDQLPSAACQRISAALDRPLPETCGQVPLFSSKLLDNARRAVQTFDRGVLALLILTPLLAVAALMLTPRRRRTLLQLAIGASLGVVVVRRFVMWEQGNLIDTGRPENKAARSAIVDHLMTQFFNWSAWFLVGALVIVVLALVTGPYRWAVRGRRRVVTAGSKVRDLAVAGATAGAAGAAAGAGRVRDESTVAWVRAHFDVLRIGGVLVAVLLLLMFDVGFWGFLVLAALLALYETWLHRLRPPTQVTLPPSG